MKVASAKECTVESDAELAARFERDAMPYYATLLRSARQLTRSEADAEDLVQDALMNAYAGFRRFQPGTNLRAWLFRIMRNRWISIHRLTQRRPVTFYVEEITDLDCTSSASHSTRNGRSAEDDALDRIPDCQLSHALQSLPEGFQKVLYYTGVAGHTYAETASLLGIPKGTVMSRMSRGRARLRSKLSEYEGVSATNETRGEYAGYNQSSLPRNMLTKNYVPAGAARPIAIAPVHGPDHTALVSRDIARTVRFYHELLEFPLTEVFEDRGYPGTTRFFFDIGNGNLLAFDFPGLGLAPPNDVRSSLNHVAINVEPARLETLRVSLQLRASSSPNATRSRCTFATPTVLASNCWPIPFTEMNGTAML